MPVTSAKPGRTSKTQFKQPQTAPKKETVTACYCENGHSLFSELTTFEGFPGITLKLRNPYQQGRLALSPVIGDKSRIFFDCDWVPSEIVDICCPTCSQPLPVYDQCFCGANLVAIFTSQQADFANCIGICQRIGCTHASINSNRELRLYSRYATVHQDFGLYGR